MKKLFPLFVIALLCLVGCTNEEIMNTPKVKGSVQASFEGSKSRLAVGEGNALTWSEADAFKMFNEDGLNSEWTLEGIGGEETGTFVGEKLEGTLKGAAFPASANPSLTDNLLTMTLPAELSYKAGICNLPMWASFNSLDAAISFRHLGALLKIDFTEIPVGYNSLIVTADKPLAGTFAADLSQTEPVLTAADGAVNSVTVTFEASENKENKMFYIPLPAGEYGSINVSVSNGENTLSIADWSKRTIVRKKVYLASLTYKTTAAKTTTEIDEALGESKTVTLNVTEKVEDVTDPITLPANAMKVGLNFAEVPTTSDTNPLKIEESGETKNAVLNINIPASQTPDSYLTLDVPNTTVNVESGNYMKIIARTATNTLILGADVTVEELVVLGGNVVLDGAKVTGSIVQDESSMDDVTFVYIKGTSTLQNVTLGAGVQEPDYLTFKAEGTQTLTLSKAVETLEYSVGGAAWAELGTTTVDFGTTSDLRLRGKSAIGTATSNKTADAATITFGNTSTTVVASGDIRTLVDYENYTNDVLDTSNARFCKLFSFCTVLTSAPKLPATTLADYCYANMFMSCRKLTEAPALPATTLAVDCYSNMFANCTSLTKAPVLPATTLSESCYNMMFYRCTALEKAPALPATTMTNRCYDSMLMGCTKLTEAPVLPATTLASECYAYMLAETSLTKAPALPATILAPGCYRNMFQSCTNLTKAPVLHAKTLMNYCYRQMFWLCENLNSVAMLATDVSATGCLYNWLVSTAETGTFYKNSGIEDDSVLGVPEGWTITTFSTNTVWTSETVASDFVLGSGTESDPYLIRSAEDFQWAKENRNGYMRLETDLVINSDENTPWEPIGKNSGNAFYGTFDGNGKTISGTLHQGSQILTDFGLFGYGSYAVIKNLNVDATVTATSAVNVGGIAGNWIGFDNKMFNCTFKGTVNAGTAERWSNKFIGGLVGYSSAQMDNCTNYGTVNGVEADVEGILKKSYIGGVVGNLGTIMGNTVNNCDNKGTVFGGVATEASYTGGIAGYCQSTLKGCDNTGTINAGSGSGSVYTGGLVGYNDKGVICTCCTDTSNTSIGSGSEGYTTQTPVEGCTY